MRRKTPLLGALLLCVCSLGPVSVASPVFAGAWPCADDTVRAVVVTNAIHVYHDEAEWNCCATIEFDLAAHADTFDLYESETYSGDPCFCSCCFDLLATITGAAPGDYLVRVLAAASGELFGEVWVNVPEVVPGGDAAAESSALSACAAGLGGTLQSPCGGWTVDVTQPQWSWGRVKTTFR
jgi:hypothetical protein